MDKKLFFLILKGLLFVVILITTINALSPLFTEQQYSVWDKFYSQEENTVDVLILGNSHANSGIDIDILSGKLNAKTISLATRGQNIYQSYYCALEAYQYQTPEVLIIENFLFYERLTYDKFVNQDPSLNDYMKRYLTYEGKRIGEIKIKEAQDFFEGNLLENTFPLLKKHSRWTDVKKLKKRLYDTQKPRKQTGTTILSVSSADKYKSQTEFDIKKYDLLPDELKSLNNIIELAKAKGTKQVVLLTLPFYKDYRNKIDYNSLDSPIQEFVKNKKGVKYLDLNKIYPNWDRTYFSNDPVGYNQHLNYKGAIVASNYITNYITLKKERSNVEFTTPESVFYNHIKKDTLENGKTLKGNLEAINGSKNVSVQIRQNNYNSAVLTGWMTPEGEQSTFDNEMLVVLEKNDNFIYFSSPSQINTRIRTDVTKYFKKEEKLYDYSGFKINILTNFLEKGEYKIHLGVIKRDGSMIYKPTYKSIEIL